MSSAYQCFHCKAIVPAGQNHNCARANETTAPVEGQLARWRDNLRITQGSPICGDALHGPALDFVIEQIDGILARAEQPRPTEAGGWRNPAPDAAAPAVTTGYHFVMSTADLRPTEAPISLHKPQTSPDATPGKAMADGLAGEYAVLVTFGGKVWSALIQPEMSLRILAALTTDGVVAGDSAFLKDLAGRIFRKATPLQGFDQGDVDQLYRIASALTTGADGVAAENEAGLDGLRRLAGDRDFSNAFVGESTRLYFDAERAGQGRGEK